MAPGLKRRNGQEEVAGLPARRLDGRGVVVVLGASESGLSLLSRTLHALGVDMLEGDAADMWSGEGAEWRRPWVAEINNRLLKAIDRPPDHPAHALPFPPGWWRRPAVQAIRREATAALEEALGDHPDPWGFADLATARLLPVWTEAFERLGIQPDYLWALTHPAKREPSASRRRRGAPPEEVNWFAYNSDVYRYAGERIAAVVEENAWRDDPQVLLDKLLGRLRLHWRGTRLDLFETLQSVWEEGEEPAHAAGPVLPIALSFYEAAAQADDDPAARERLESLSQGAELLRPMITPLLGKLANGAAATPPNDGEVIRLQQEVAELRTARAELERRLNGHAPAPHPPLATDGDDRLPALEQELEARSAEIRWLHEQYRERLAEAESEAATLRTQMAAAEISQIGNPATEEELAHAHAEIQRLTAEMRNLNNANERYLARIYELKKALEERGGL